MIQYKKITKIALVFMTVGAMTSCTKLHENLNSTLTSSQVTSALGANGVALLLGAAYSDLTFLPGQDQFFHWKKTQQTNLWYLQEAVTGMTTAYGELFTTIPGMRIMARY